MVLQLSGAAGTYPLELSGEFYQKIHPYMPFTYTVNAFRSTTANGLDISHDMTILCSIFVVFLVANLAVIYFKAKHQDSISHSSVNSNSNADESHEVVA
jgi:putative membrane protein